MESVKKIKFIIKIAEYLLFVRLIYIGLLGLIACIPLGLVYIFMLLEPTHNFISKYIFETGFILLCITSPFVCYLTAKLFGMFSYIDKLKIALTFKVLLVALISFVSFGIMYFDIKSFDSFHVINISSHFPYFIFGLVPAFFLYKYFNYLTMKYPVPFKKIGYYSSVEFYKDLWRKIRKK